MKSILLLAFILFACASSSANAWFFFFIPPLGGGSAVGTDNTCVAVTAKEGDTFNSTNGNVAKVSKLSGTSSRCKDADKPILAAVDYTSTVNFTSKAGIDLPEKFKPMTLTDRQRYFEGILLKAKTNDGNLFIPLGSIRRSILSSVPEYVMKFKAGLKNLDDATYSETTEFSANGLPAWQFEQKGKLKNLFGSRMTVLHTILESKDEAILIQAWGYDNQYAEEKEEFKKLAFSIRDLSADIASAAVEKPAMQPATITSVALMNTPTVPAGAVLQKSVALLAAEDDVADNPAKAGAWERLGAIHLNEKSYTKAVMSYQEAFKRNPKSADAIVGLGSAYNALGDKDQVQALYGKLKALDVTRAATYFKDYLLP